MKTLKTGIVTKVVKGRIQVYTAQEYKEQQKPSYNGLLWLVYAISMAMIMLGYSKNDFNL